MALSALNQSASMHTHGRPAEQSHSRLSSSWRTPVSGLPPKARRARREGAAHAGRFVNANAVSVHFTAITSFRSRSSVAAQPSGIQCFPSAPKISTPMRATPNRPHTGWTVSCRSHNAHASTVLEHPFDRKGVAQISTNDWLTSRKFERFAEPVYNSDEIRASETLVPIFACSFLVAHRLIISAEYRRSESRAPERLFNISGTN